MKEESVGRLAVFKSDCGITISFGDKTYFVDKAEAFHNIALKALEIEDYIPFYVEIARREGKGEEFVNSLKHQIQKQQHEDL
jgi:hypothetical protein